MEIKKLPEKDLDEAYALDKKYVHEDSTLDEFKKFYQENPKLYVGCYEEGELIGLVYGSTKEDFVILNSIAVRGDYWRKGIGSKLLKKFEEQVKKLNATKISVVAAEGWVENFYLKNGFELVAFFVQIKKNKLPKDYKKFGYKIVKEKEDMDKKILFIETKELSTKDRETIRKKFNAEQVNYLFEKKL